MATKEQIKRIYGLGAGLGIVGKNRDDALHELVFACTGKESIKALDDADFIRVEGELLSRMRYSNPQHPKHVQNKNNGNNGMATKEQQSLCWRFCYRLKELDDNPQSADAGDRLIGAITKILGITASKKEPFRWVNQEQCSKLIEQLKRYVNTAERRSKRHGDKIAGI